MNSDLLQKQKLLQDFQARLDSIIEFLDDYPEDYIDLQKELIKVSYTNKMKLEWLHV